VKYISKNTLSKLGKYSFVAGATLSVLSGCGSDDENENALIGYVDIHPDINLVPTESPYLFDSILAEYGLFDFFSLNQLIDFNEDGIDDVSIRIANYYAWQESYDYDENEYFSFILDKGESEVNGLNGAEILTRIEPLDTVDGFVTKGLEVGDEINSAQTIWGENGELGIDEKRKIEPEWDSETDTYIFESIETSVFGDFLGIEKFIGVQFEAAGQTHFGWIRVSVALNGKSLKIKDYAYHKVPNTSINAGMK
jgi:hypothetical protein